jgi:hypothetical protein
MTYADWGESKGLTGDFLLWSHAANSNPPTWSGSLALTVPNTASLNQKKRFHNQLIAYKDISSAYNISVRAACRSYSTGVTNRSGAYIGVCGNPTTAGAITEFGWCCGVGSGLASYLGATGFVTSLRRPTSTSTDAAFPENVQSGIVTNNEWLYCRLDRVYNTATSDYYRAYTAPANDKDNWTLRREELVTNSSVVYQGWPNSRIFFWLGAANEASNEKGVIDNITIKLTPI